MYLKKFYVQMISDLLEVFIACLLASSTLLHDDYNFFQVCQPLRTSNKNSTNLTAATLVRDRSADKIDSLQIPID